MVVRKDEQKAKAPCLSCRHYFITWDEQRPYGCRAFGFKAKMMPCYEVQSASSTDCLKYEAKVIKRDDG